MSLASDLHSLLTRFRTRVAERVNSGELLTVDQHLSCLAAVAEGDVQRADAQAHAVLAELYTALHATTSGAPAAPPTPTPAAAPAAPPVAAPAPAPTTAAAKIAPATAS
ncbi:hypothetical protein P3T36_006895 [Kitasatospora sp. MAP12-15]|uniref:hypothetical protein n=1 Tax=unclassified Kitasatospora TaxID=2633591 RepID=UPI002474511C|nr:hypothetical protein [Kitasatospora sp. MAP12-44]MDH6111922.1 hypothetical protein [Kitasatospora sp. MAP12-44]